MAKNRNLGKQVGDFVLWENDKVRVWDQVIMPGETVGPHDHDHDYFIVVLENAKMTADMINDKRSEVEFVADNLIWVKSNGEVHTATNVDNKRWRNLIIEVKK
ncbi:MAG: hypothetical protein HY261_07580 [Chloroflexi bacterium]|nr:hypothetical protein [Chloroflexota bacterium]